MDTFYSNLCKQFNENIIKIIPDADHNASSMDCFYRDLCHKFDLNLKKLIPNTIDNFKINIYSFDPPFGSDSDSDSDSDSYSECDEIYLGYIFGINEKTIYKLIISTIQLLYTKMNFINFPKTKPIYLYKDKYCGAIDCTTMKRTRIHPGNAVYYRFDKGEYQFVILILYYFIILLKGCHFLTVQCIVGFDGIFYHIAIGKGHNNDKGMYLKSEISEKLKSLDFHLLADQGYCESYKNLKVCYNQSDCSKRTVIENQFSRIHSFKMASLKCRLSVDKQYMVVSIIFNLVNIIKYFELEREDELCEMLS
ncbi:hypothetical protein ACTFIY_003002 [Dictyostelium cf. discoideum]